MSDKKIKQISFEIVEKDINEEKKTLTSYVSTNAVDRDNEIVTASLIDDTNYSKNPVVLFNHNSNFPIGKSLWRKANETGLLASTQFSKSGLGEEIFDLYSQKILNAFSIGFRALEQGKFTEGIYYFGRVELYEYSSVSVPANPHAVTLGFVKGLKSPELKESFINEYLFDSFDTEIKSIKENIEIIKNSGEIDFEKLVQEEIQKQIKELTPKFNEIKSEINKLKIFKNKFEVNNLIGS